MYRPARFDMPALELCHEFIERESFATLVSPQLTTAGPAEPLASHVPLYLDRDRGERGTLFGHLAAPNPHCAVLEAGSALAVFSGPHAYPGDYPDLPDAALLGDFDGEERHPEPLLCRETRLLKG